jgi:predicted dithiol-disulfide oxidoreductase (DUF899 family)
MAKSLHSIRFPGESAKYRAQRNALLEAEIDLRRQIERVAALRRALPLGGPVKEDYIFEEVNGGLDAAAPNRKIHLSQLFSEGRNSLIVYSFMYGQAMERACPSCTSILDALDGTARHAEQRVNLAVVAKSPPARIGAFARQRAWRNLRLLSSAGNTFNHDYHAETSTGSQIPAINVFVKRGAAIHHFFNAELLYAPPEPGQNGRQADLLWPLWNLFDMIPEGRGMDWHPKLSYGS